MSMWFCIAGSAHFSDNELDIITSVKGTCHATIIGVTMCRRLVNFYIFQTNFDMFLFLCHDYSPFLLVTSTIPLFPSTLTQSPVSMTSSGSWSRRSTTGISMPYNFCDKTAPAKMINSVSLLINALGAFPHLVFSRIQVADAVEPLPSGYTRTLSFTFSPHTLTLTSTISPVGG